MTAAQSEPVEPAGTAQQNLNASNIHQVQAVALAGLADEFATMSVDLAHIFNAVKPVFTGPGAEEARQALDALASAMPRQTQAVADRLRLASQASAAMSFANEELIASGGPDNPDALARYQEADRWYADLITAERPEDDVPPLS